MPVTIHHPDAPWLQQSGIIRLFDAFTKNDAELRVVGGCVRDFLCGRTIKDWDLATTALPEQSMDICHNMGAHVIATGLKHGTITAIINSVPFEITTLRHDAITDGRHAEVVWSDDWLEDAMRRDFTINALYGDAQGNVIDYTGGYADLQHRLIRFIGEPKQRISEDHLRIMRFFRFMSGYGDFDHMDQASLQASIQMQETLTLISRERIRDELLKILISAQRAKIIPLMMEHHIFANLNIAVTNADLHQLNHQEQQYGLALSSLRALAYILDTQQPWNILKQRLILSNKQMAYLQGVRQYYPDSNDISPQQLRRIYYHMRKKSNAIDAMEYTKDIALLNNVPASQHWDNIYVPEFPVVGDDLFKLGFSTGKELGIFLKQLEQQYIDSDFTLSKDALLLKVKRSS